MLARFQHILVPVDFTAKNFSALDVAFDIAVQNRARVTLLHVIETLDFSADEEIRDFYRQLETRAQTELESLAQRFDDAGLAVDRKIWYGKRAQEIVRYSMDQQVDLIVLSSHKVDADAPIQSLGTLSYQVSLFCQCPVLLVK
jgi:universal stress protein A